MTEVTLTQMARLSGKGWRTVRDRLEVARVRPIGSTKKSDLFDSREALPAIYAVDTDPGDFDSQRERLAAAQAERVEMENAIRRGQIADLAVVARFWTDCLAAMRARLLNMGPKLAPLLVGLDAGAIAATIRTEVHAALAELAEFEPPIEK